MSMADQLSKARARAAHEHQQAKYYKKRYLIVKAKLKEATKKETTKQRVRDYCESHTFNQAVEHFQISKSRIMTYCINS